MAYVVCHVFRARGENQTAFRFNSYQEDGGRIGVQTESTLFEFQPKNWLNLSGEIIYDSVSGFSPTGAPPPSTITFVQTPPPPGASRTTVPLSHMRDGRLAETGGATISYLRSRFTPQFSFSEESDYISRGVSLNYSVDLNEKNTTLNFGWSHDFDRVLPNGFLKNSEQRKDTDDLIAGVNQLLGPKTVLTFNLSYGYSTGYLNDQYKGVLFDNEPQGSPDSPALEAENRPGHRAKYNAYVSLTQDVTPAHASAELTGRLTHDSYDITSETIELAWFQKLGKQVVLSPMFRYYHQNQASFYATRFPDFNNAPTYYSADYRLSELETFAIGVSLNWKIKDWLSLDLGYKRYAMRGLDGVTSQSAYPSANMLSAGARVWF